MPPADRAGLPFVALAPARPLAVSLPVPVRAAAGDDRLHLLGGWSSSRPGVHLALDAAGDVAAGPTPLPLGGVSSTAVLAGGLLAGGSALEDGRPAVVELDPAGGVRRLHQLPHLGPVAAWPAVASAGGLACALWATGTDPWVTLWCASLDGGAAPPVSVLEPGAPIREVVVAHVDGRLVAACLLHGDPAAVELLELDDGQPGRRARLPAPGAFSLGLAPVGPGGLLAWAARVDRAAHARRIGPGLSLEAETTGVSAGPGERLRSVRLAGDGGSGLAVLVQAAASRPGPTGVRVGAGPGLRSRPGVLRVRHRLAGPGALRDGRAAAVDLHPPGVVHEAAGWLGDRLLVVHGDAAPAVSAFARGPGYR